MAILDKFPGLKRVVLELGGEVRAYKDLSEEEYLSKTDSVVEHYSGGQLMVLDKFCGTLTDDEVTTLAFGVEDEMFNIIARCSQREALNHLLNALFEEDYWK